MHACLKRCFMKLSFLFRKPIMEPGLVLPNFKVSMETRTETDAASQASIFPGAGGGALTPAWRSRVGVGAFPTPYLGT